MDSLNKDFVISVLRRMRKSMGTRATDNTIENYARQVLSLKKLDLSNDMCYPRQLLDALCTKYRNASTIVNIIRPVATFLGNLTSEEFTNLNQNVEKDNVLEQYVEVLKEVNAIKIKQMTHRVDSYKQVT